MGAFLLKELCSKNVANVWCLVRGNSKEAGKQRVKGKYLFYLFLIHKINYYLIFRKHEKI